MRILARFTRSAGIALLLPLFALALTAGAVSAAPVSTVTPLSAGDRNTTFDPSGVPMPDATARETEVGRPDVAATPENEQHAGPNLQPDPRVGPNALPDP